MNCKLYFDTAGQPAAPAQFEQLIAAAKSTGTTDLILLAHGFRCAPADATALYAALLSNLEPQLAGTPGRIFTTAGVYWPSQKYPESFPQPPRGAAACNRKVQDEYVASVLSALNDGSDDPCEGLPLLHQLTGSELLENIAASPARPQDGIQSLGHPILAAIDAFLNFMSWSAIKKLSADVGGNGLAPIVSALQAELPAIRVHLVGHSLGGRLMTACAKMLGQTSAKPLASLSLLEAAFSHFGFSADAGSGTPGFFRSVIESRVVQGPLIATFSKQDTVVGTAYAVASRLAHDRLQSIGDCADPYGGIGHNGALRTSESVTCRLRRAGTPYEFRPGIVTCLNGSDGYITGHSDVTNTHVTHAIASAISQVP